MALSDEETLRDCVAELFRASKSQPVWWRAADIDLLWLDGYVVSGFTGSIRMSGLSWRLEIKPVTVDCIDCPYIFYFQIDFTGSVEEAYVILLEPVTGRDREVSDVVRIGDAEVDAGLAMKLALNLVKGAYSVDVLTPDNPNYKFSVGGVRLVSSPNSSGERRM